MSSPLRYILCVSLLCAETPLGLAESSPTGGAKGSYKVNVHVYNYAGVQPWELAQAEHEARRIFRKAGIETEWLDSPTGKEVPRIDLCDHALGPSHLIVNILSYSVTKGFDSQNDSFGVAFAGVDEDLGSCAYVFYDRLKGLAIRTGVDKTVLLAYFSAHEIGHLLLGLNSHSPVGLMRGEWFEKDLDRAAKGYLAFSIAESERMRSAVLARNRKGSKITVSSNE